VVLPVRRDRVARAVALAVAAVVFLGCWEVLHHWFYSRHQIVDTPIYEGYGQAMRHGLLPYRDIPVEYPPGALPVFEAPTYVDGYDETFGWLMAALGVGCIAFVAAAGASAASLAAIAVSPLLIGSIALSRYDFWPAMLVAGAVASFLHDRHRIGWAALAAAIAAKLFAAVLVPVALVWTLRRRGVREMLVGAGAAIGVVAAAALPFAVLAPAGLWHSLSGQLSRPLQVESLGASVLTTFGRPTVIATHGSLNLAGQGAVATASTVVELTVILVLWVAFARGAATPERFLRYCAACVCAFVAFGKVLSPQFLIWLVPLVPLVRGRRGVAAAVLLATALVMTQVYFPARYFRYIFHLQLAWLVLARNLVLVALLATLSLSPRGWRRSS